MDPASGQGGHGRGEERRSLAREAPWWAWASGALLAACGAAYFVVDAVPTAVEYAAMAFRYAVEGGALVWASRRADLPRRLRWSLGIFGATSLLSLAELPLEVGRALGRFSGVEGIVFAAVASSFGLALLSLLVFPRAPMRSWHSLSVALDLGLLAGAVATLQGTLLATPATQALPAWEFATAVVYGLAQVLMMVGLGLLIDRGQATPSRAAFWWYVASLAAYLPMGLLGQVHSIYGVPWAFRLSQFIYFAGTCLMLVAAVHFRAAPVSPVPRSAAPPWLLGLNPLTLAMAPALGGAMVLAIVRGADSQALPLGVALVVSTLLLVARLVVTALENHRLVEEERRAESRLREQQHLARREERARLVADMHDGFGSQLVSARIRAGQGPLAPEQVAGLVGECLADLYLVVDSMKAEDSSLAVALGDYRGRLQRRLEGGPTQVAWRVDLEQAPAIPAGTIL